jgi:hypothetical protein
MFASQQAAQQGDNGLLRAYQPRAEAARAINLKPIWRARTTEGLQRALDHAQSAMFEALHGDYPDAIGHDRLIGSPHRPCQPSRPTSIRAHDNVAKAATDTLA